MGAASERPVRYTIRKWVKNRGTGREWVISKGLSVFYTSSRRYSEYDDHSCPSPFARNRNHPSDLHWKDDLAAALGPERGRTWAFRRPDNDLRQNRGILGA